MPRNPLKPIKHGQYLKFQPSKPEYSSANDKKEIKLMEEHWNEKLTDDEWLELCNKHAKRMAYKK